MKLTDTNKSKEIAENPLKSRQQNNHTMKKDNYSGLGGMYSSDDMKEALKLKADETGTVRWSFHFDSDKKPAKFRLTSAFEQE
jgi:hypothetical protein